MNIREAIREDFEQIWPIFHEIVAAGETYGYPQDVTREQALELWTETPRKTYVLEETGTFWARTISDEQLGPGDHVSGYRSHQPPEARRGHGDVRAFSSNRTTWVQGHAVQFRCEQ